MEVMPDENGECELIFNQYTLKTFYCDLVSKVEEMFSLPSLKLLSSSINNNYKDFDIINYETMIKEIKEMKKTLKTIQENKEMEIVEYDLDYDLKVLFSMDKEEDEEYFEIMRSRRIKKKFMINN